MIETHQSSSTSLSYVQLSVLRRSRIFQSRIFRSRIFSAPALTLRDAVGCSRMSLVMHGTMDRCIFCSNTWIERIVGLHHVHCVARRHQVRQLCVIIIFRLLYHAVRRVSATTRSCIAVSRYKPGCSLVMESHGKSWNLVRPFSRLGELWRTRKIMETDCKIMEFL